MFHIGPLIIEAIVVQKVCIVKCIIVRPIREICYDINHPQVLPSKLALRKRCTLFKDSSLLCISNATKVFLFSYKNVIFATKGNTKFLTYSSQCETKEVPHTHAGNQAPLSSKSGSASMERRRNVFLTEILVNRCDIFLDFHNWKMKYF